MTEPKPSEITHEFWDKRARFIEMMIRDPDDAQVPELFAAQLEKYEHAESSPSVIFCKGLLKLQTQKLAEHDDSAQHAKDELTRSRARGQKHVEKMLLEKIKAALQYRAGATQEETDSLVVKNGLGTITLTAERFIQIGNALLSNAPIIATVNIVMAKTGKTEEADNTYILHTLATSPLTQKLGGIKFSKPAGQKEKWKCHSDENFKIFLSSVGAQNIRALDVADCDNASAWLMHLSHSKHVHLHSLATSFFLTADMRRRSGENMLSNNSYMQIPPNLAHLDVGDSPLTEAECHTLLTHNKFSKLHSVRLHAENVLQVWNYVQHHPPSDNVPPHNFYFLRSLQFANKPTEFTYFNGFYHLISNTKLNPVLPHLQHLGWEEHSTDHTFGRVYSMLAQARQRIHPLVSLVLGKQGNILAPGYEYIKQAEREPLKESPAPKHTRIENDSIRNTPKPEVEKGWRIVPNWLRRKPPGQENAPG